MRTLLTLYVSLITGCIFPHLLYAQAGPDRLACPGGRVRIGESGFDYGGKHQPAINGYPKPD
jgi:hypothetical protein